MAVKVYEFLYRGPFSFNGDKAAWHVMLGNEVDDGFGTQKFVQTSALTPTAAAEMGFDLSKIISEINTEVLAHKDQLEAEKIALENAKAELEATNATIALEKAILERAKTAIETEKAALEAANSQLEAEKAALQKALDNASKTAAEAVSTTNPL